MTEPAPANPAPTGGDPAPANPTPAPSGEPPAFAVPERYAETKWANNLKSNDDLWDQFAGAQSMIGKKVIPASDAPDEEWKDYFDNIRPENADAYELQGREGVELDDSFEADVRQIFHEEGLTPRS